MLFLICPVRVRSNHTNFPLFRKLRHLWTQCCTGIKLSLIVLYFTTSCYFILSSKSEFTIQNQSGGQEIANTNSNFASSLGAEAPNFRRYLHKCPFQTRLIPFSNKAIFQNSQYIYEFIEASMIEYKDNMIRTFSYCSKSRTRTNICNIFLLM